MSAMTRLAEQLSAIYDRRGRGDLRKRIHGVGSRDSRIVKALNTTISMMDNLVFKLKSSATDSMKSNTVLTDEAAKVEANSKIIVKELLEIESRMQNLITVVNDSKNLGENISGTSREISSQIEAQASAVTQSTAAVTEMVASIRNISGISTDRLERIHHLKDAADAGRENVARNEEIISSVAANADQIQSFISIIDNIAAQTNLLAMNAAIEAAHAGDAGRGFSVVADEVRKLAGNTEENAKSISSNLKEVMQGIQEAQGISEKVTASYDEILKDMALFADGVSEISQGLDELSSGTGEIDKALAELSTITSDVERSSLDITDKSTRVHKSLGEVGKLSDENAAYIENIGNKVSNTDEIIREVTQISRKNQNDILSLLAQVEKITITDFNTLKSVDNQPLIMWNSLQKTIPQRPADPKSLDKLDPGYWWDEEFACFQVEKKTLPESPCDGPKGKRIAAFVPGVHPYYLAYEKGMKQIAKMMEIDLEVSVGDWTGAPQEVFFNKVLKGDYDLVIAIPADRKAYQEAAVALWKRKIPLIASQDSPTVETYKYILSYTGFDDWGTHRIFGRHFADLLGKKGGYAVVGHQTGGGQDTARCYGFASEISKYAPDLKLYGMEASDLDYEKTYRMAGKWLDSHGEKINGIFIADSLEPLKAVIKLCEERGRDDIKVYTTGCNTYSLDMTQKGKCHGIRWESAGADGAIAIETAVSWFNGLVIDPIRYLPMHVVTAKDATGYLPAQW